VVRLAVRDRPGATCWEITRLLPWSRTWDQIHGHMRRAAVGETLAHLVLLEARGVLRREPAQPWRWVPGPAEASGSVGAA
jgi:hypothetical protein